MAVLPILQGRSVDVSHWQAGVKPGFDMKASENFTPAAGEIANVYEGTSLAFSDVAANAPDYITQTDFNPMAPATPIQENTAELVT